MTARNIFRYKQRMLVTIFGVAGAWRFSLQGVEFSGLSMGLPIASSRKIITYDAIVSKDTVLTASEEQTASTTILSSSSVTSYSDVYS